LKKSVLVFKAEKYASEIEILNLRRGLRAEILRSSVLKRRFHRPMFRQFGKSDFFNRIGQKQMLGQVRVRPSPHLNLVGLPGFQYWRQAALKWLFGTALPYPVDALHA
jgi:hypothetical protein